MRKKAGLAWVLAAMLILGAGCGGSTADKTQTEGDGRKTVSVTPAEAAGTNGTTGGSFLTASVSLDAYDTTVWTRESAEQATVIRLNGDTAEISGTGCTMADGSLTIAEAGTYVLSGTLTDGSVIVDTDKESIVNLVLAGVDLTCSNSSAIYIKKSLKTVLSLQEGTVNTLTDGVEYLFDDAEKEEPSATLFSKSDLTINGEGTLIINANHNDAVKCKDSLKLLSGSYEIVSVDDGIIGKDMLVIEGGTFHITTEGDGFKATNDSDETLGFLTINGGTFEITAGKDAIQAETNLLISDGIFTITTGGGSQNATSKGEDWGWGFWGREGSMATATETESTSEKGLKAGGCLQISGGTFIINSCDDGIHSNDTVAIYGGTFSIDTGDDGIHADTELTIYGGTIDITNCYEGLEAFTITIQEGTVSIVASDDGVNAAGKSSGTSTGGFGFGGMEASQGACMIINGGTLRINAGGDGLDANGSVQMNGGTVYVDGPTNDGNGGLDYDTTFEITGGTLVVAGSSGMAQAPSTATNQACISLTFSQTQAAGTVVTVTNAEGTEIISYAPSKQFSNIIISTPDMVVGEEYTVAYQGTEIGTVTLPTAVCYLSQDGTVSSAPSGMGGMGGFGGGMGGGMPQGGQGGMNGQGRPGAPGGQGGTPGQDGFGKERPDQQ